jgi:hypothetical protein
MIRTTVLDPNRTGKDATDLEIGLRRQVVGQDEAIEQTAQVYQIHRIGLSPQGRPIGNFLFLGPKGSGKTRVVEATARALLDNPKGVVKTSGVLVGYWGRGGTPEILAGVPQPLGQNRGLHGSQWQGTAPNSGYRARSGSR